MRTKWLAVLAVGLLLAADRPDDDAKKELEKLQGTWVMVGLEVEGQQVPAEKLQGAKLVIKDNKYIVTTRGQSHETVLTLDPSKKPKAIDMVFSDGPNKDKVHPGIYELDGDTFKVCRAQGVGSERPTEFATKPNSGLFIVVWLREVK